MPGDPTLPVVPLHLGFFLYAAARGDFVLGGLQAVFETELHRLLAGVVEGDQRCPLDPGCQRSGGACMACLHVGEVVSSLQRVAKPLHAFGSEGVLQALATTYWPGIVPGSNVQR